MANKGKQRNHQGKEIPTRAELIAARAIIAAAGGEHAIRNKERLSPPQLRFLAAYRNCGVITTALKTSEVLRTVYRRWKQEKPIFCVELLDAYEEAKDTIMQKCRDVATDGNVPMLIHLSKGYFPELWGTTTTKHEMSPLEVTHTHNVTVTQLFEKMDNVKRTKPNSHPRLNGRSNMVVSKDGIECTKKPSPQLESSTGTIVSGTGRQGTADPTD